MFGSGRSGAKGDRRGSVVRAVVFLAALLATAVGAFFLGRSQSPASLSETDRESVALYAEALDAVREDYVDQEAVSPKKQTYGAIEGMLDTLGDKGHTRFLTPEERKQNREGLSGTYVGIGVQLEEEEDEVVISSPIPGSPAEEAGVEAGDVVVAVDGESVRDAEIPGVIEKVKGPEGTAVELTVLRNKEERVFDLERAEIKSSVASWAMIGDSDVALVSLTSFSNDSAEELREAFGEAREAGARSFVLDLRNNPGGALDQAVEISEFFLEPGEVIYIREEAGGERERIRAGRSEGRTEAPVAVLVNGGSASSSEIVSGALRDNDRAVVVGETTVGTGTVLAEVSLRDGSSILLGVAEWLTPSGDFIRETGIDPDIEVPLEDGDEPLAPGDLRDLSREEILSKDAQIARAFEELRE